MFLLEAKSSSVHEKVLAKLSRAQGDPSCTILWLSYLTLNKNDVLAVIAFLQQTPQITQLHLERCKVEHNDGASVLFTKFLQTTTVSHICAAPYETSNNTTSSTLDLLACGLHGNKYTKNLTMGSFDFGNLRNCGSLSNLLIGKSDLKILELWYCKFKPATFELLAEALKGQDFLQELKFFQATGGTDEEFSKVIHALTGQGMLRKLALCRCGLGTKSLQALTSFLATSGCALQVLYLGENEDMFRSPASSQQFLSTMMLSNSSLFDVSTNLHCYFGSKIAKILKRNKLMFMVEKSPTNSSLTSVILCKFLSRFCQRSVGLSPAFLFLSRSVVYQLAGG